MIISVLGSRNSRLLKDEPIRRPAMSIPTIDEILNLLKIMTNAKDMMIQKASEKSTFILCYLERAEFKEKLRRV
jgi:hypothetical protein